MHELPGPECDPDVRGPVAHRLEEHQIPSLHVIAMDLASFVVLLACFTREACPVLREDPLYEAAAIEPA